VPEAAAAPPLLAGPAPLPAEPLVPAAPPLAVTAPDPPEPAPRCDPPLLPLSPQLAHKTNKTTARGEIEGGEGTRMAGFGEGLLNVARRRARGPSFFWTCDQGRAYWQSEYTVAERASSAAMTGLAALQSSGLSFTWTSISADMLSSGLMSVI